MKAQEKYNVTRLSHLRERAHDLARQVKRPCVILLKGPLGAGKTQMASFMAEALGAASKPSSPAFSLIQSYSAQGGEIHHADLLRLKSLEELEETGFWDIFAQPGGLLFVEWPDLLKKEQIPLSWQKLLISLWFERERRWLSCRFF